MQDIIQDEKVISFDKALIQNELEADIKQLFGKVLKEKEAYVLIRRFGLFGQKSATAEELAKELHCVSNYVRMMENKALRKLRDPRKNKQLREYMKS